MNIIPLTLKQANDFVEKHHRHNKRVAVHRFSIGAQKDGNLIGVAICANPIARRLDNGLTLEIRRVCTDGTKNANSFLFSRCKKIGQLMGFKRIITYTLTTESQSSLKAIKAIPEVIVKSSKNGWNRNNRKREWREIYGQQKTRWKL